MFTFTKISLKRASFLAFEIFLLFTSCLGAFYLAEMAASHVEPQSVGGFKNKQDKSLGWLPEPGVYRQTSKEFDLPLTVNSLNMNDREFSEKDFLANNKKILVVGDSHTFAIGASVSDIWPKILEKRLFPKDEGTVFNSAVVGYSLGQYLLRYRSLRDKINPSILLVGFSMATDLYDLLPPARGGFIYGGDAERDYFDLDENGNLTEKHFVASSKNDRAEELNASQKIRGYLEQFALYRFIKRSKAAMMFATFYRPGGKSLWPGLDVALKRKLSNDDIFQWNLAEKILQELVFEAKERETKVVIVEIPYLPQVYDEVWTYSFGLDKARYDRNIGTARLEAICARIGAYFLDTTPNFVDAMQSRSTWLHWPQDAHPNPDGQKVIGEAVAVRLKDLALVSAD